MNAETESKFARRMDGVPRSFIREILKVAVSPDVISFAGGLPNKALFPLEELHECADLLMSGNDRTILQYANTEGFLPLREAIADRYARKGLRVSPSNILITNGSQQGLDLLGKIFVDEGDGVLIEEPGYLGAIQAFSIFKPEFIPVPLEKNGINTTRMAEAIEKHRPRLAYLIPNFQNPSGVSYDLSTRQQVASICKNQETFVIEDDPYGDIRFSGNHLPSLAHYLPEKTILLGTFSKTVVPAFRIGWIVAPEEVMDKLIIAKQAADLHTDYFTQRLLHLYLTEYNIDEHIAKISKAYGIQASAMMDATAGYFPENIEYTQPEGGMFMWVTLPEGKSAMQLFERSIREKVAFVPGDPFYVNKKDINTLRLNFSCSTPSEINSGIQKLGQILDSF